MESRGYSNEVSDILFDMEIVAWATWLGLTFPLIFLWHNKNNIPQAETLIIPFAALIPLVMIPYQLATGHLFPQIATKWPEWIRRGLYLWGWFLLVLVWRLVYYTGGIQSSIFVWLFEYALIVTLIIGPVFSKSGKTLFKRWRPVLLTGTFEIIIIYVLVYLGGNSEPIPNTMNNLMPVWGGFSILSSLLTSVFLFWISIKKR